MAPNVTRGNGLAGDVSALKKALRMSAIRPGGASGNATSIQGNPVAATAPTTGQVYQWSGSEWVPATVSGSPSVTYDPMTGSGWTANASTGSAVASWETSPARLRLTCPLGSAASCRVHQSDYVPSPVWGDLAIRVQIITGDTVTTGRIGFTVGQSSTANLSINLWPNGNIEAGYYNAPTFTSLVIVAGPNSGQRTGGELWLKIGRTPASVGFAWGIGNNGALPTTWTTVVTSTAAAALVCGSGRYVEVFGLTTSSVAVTADVLAIEQGLPGAF